MSSNPNNITNLKNIFTQFTKNLLKLQEHQTKLTTEILNNISLNADNLNNNINNNQNISQSQNNLEIINNDNEESDENSLSKRAIFKKDDGNKC